jgi:predicted metal-dependent enzyme (double-stranded beta helix superfamily)
MLNQDILPSVGLFISEMRNLFASTMTDDQRWSMAAILLGRLLKDPELKKHSETWPDSPALLGLEGKHANLLFYEDPDYRFVINGLIKKLDARTTIHDHGVSWTLYGVVDGGEDVLRFERTDGAQPGDLPKEAAVRETALDSIESGYVDLIKPWEIHAEYNKPGRTVAVIVRSQRSGTYIQNIYDAKAGKVEQYWGPKQIPFDLTWGRQAS